MNYKIFYIIIFALITHSELRSEWELIDKSKLYRKGSTTGYHWNYIDLDCADENNCIALVEANTRWPWNRITSDGGKTWYSSNMDTTILKVNEKNEVIWTNDGVLRPKRVCYLDTSLCIVTADSGYYYKSMDKGLTWKKNYLPSEINLNLVNFIDNKKGVIYSNKQLYITKDCFDSFEIQDLFRPDQEEITYIEDMKVTGNQTIIILAYNKIKIDFILRSDDWGETWQYYPTIQPRVSGIYFIDPLVGWAVGSPKNENDYRRDVILHTIDGGKTWETQLDSLQKPYSGLKGIDFFDNKNGIAWGYFNKIWQTSDGGKTWIHDSNANFDYFKDWIVTCQMTGSNEFMATATETNSIYRSCKSGTGVFTFDEAFTKFSKKLFIYPNPTDGSEINIELKNEQSDLFTFSIYDIYGMKVCEDFISYVSRNQIIRYSSKNGLISGNYILYAKSENGESYSAVFTVVK